MNLKKITVLLIPSFLFFVFQPTSAQSFGWASQLGGSENEQGASIKTDAASNVYTLGTFNGTVDFDPSPATTFNVTTLGVNDIFLSKLDALGNFVWVKRIGGTLAQSGTAITLDASSNIYITGSFNGTTDFDPGAGVSNLTAVALNDIFVCKLDSNGDLVWVKQMGGSNGEAGMCLALDSNGDLYIGGNLASTIDFDPSAATNSITSLGSTDAFICKLDAAGTFIWAKRIGGSASDGIRGITSDASNNLYLLGSFSATVDFDPNGGGVNMTSFGLTDGFITKLSSSGALVWAKQFGSSLSDEVNDIELDGLGNIYATGTFQGTSDFDPSASNYDLTSFGNRDIFLLKWDALGDFVWAKQFGGTANDFGNTLAIDASNAIIIAGNFQNTADFDPNAGTYNLVSAGNSDMCFAKIDAAGNFIWAQDIGEIGLDIVNSLTLDAAGNMYATGIFQTTVDFDPSPAVVYSLTYVAGSDAYVYKLSPLPVVLPIALTSWKATCKNEVAQLSWATASERNNAYFTIESSGNALDFSAIGRVEGAGESNQPLHYGFKDTKHFFNKTTYYRLKQTDLDGKFDYSNIIALDCEPTTETIISIYPNPTTGKCTIQGLLPNTELRIINGLGAIVLEKRTDAFSTDIDLSELPKGIYFLQTMQYNSPNAELKKIVLTE
jgi:Secretion system C-terminal sorting domain/Beta-propeller repeat